MKFRCMACGSVFSAFQWNNATRKHIPGDREFIAIQKVFDDRNNPLNMKLKWFCLNCSVDELDVTVKIVEEI